MPEGATAPDLGLAPRRAGFDFSAAAGPIPSEVLAQAQHELADWRRSGRPVLTLPFTGKAFRDLLAEAEVDLRALLAIPEGYRVLFMHGGASAQFSLVPLNLLRDRTSACYLDSGYWSGRAIAEARRYCAVTIGASSAATGYDRVPVLGADGLDPDAAYCHVVANETANGVEYPIPPDTGAVPLVADMTSSFLTRPVDVARFGLIYAGAQKNVGATGLAIVIVREDLIGAAHPATPCVFDYRVQAERFSLYNTPPVFAVYLAGQVVKWLHAQGGLAAAEHATRLKSAWLYHAIEASGGFYRSAVRPGSRSRVNVCFGLADAGLTEVFLSTAAANGLHGLAGHPSVGGVRASLYNAMPEGGAEALAQFMNEFARRNG